MSTILTHEYQSIFSAFSLFLSFVTNSSMAEKAHFESTDVGLIVIKAWYSLSRLSGLFVVAESFEGLNLGSFCWNISAIFSWGICSLKHFDHLSHSCVKSLKLTTKVLFSLYFQTFWQKWQFYSVISKTFRSMTEKRTACTGMILWSSFLYGFYA